MFSKSKSFSTTEKKIEEVEMGITEAKEQVLLVIDKTLDRGDKLDELDDKANNLKDNAQMFHKQARKTRWKMFKEKCKANMIIIIITVIVIAIVVIAVSTLI